MLEETVASAVHSSIWASMTSWCTPTLLFLFLNIMIGTIAITSSLASQKATNHQDDHHQQQQHQHQDKQHQHQHQQIWRSPSMLQRLKSINFYSHRSQESQVHTTVAAAAAYEKSPAEGVFETAATHYFGSYDQTHQESQQAAVPALSRSPSVLQRLKSFNPYNYIQPPQIPTTPQREEPEAEINYTTREQQIEEEEAAETLDEIYSKLRTGNKLVGRSKSDTKPVAGEVPKKLAKKMRKSASTRSAFAHFEEVEVVEARRPATVKEGKSKKLVADEEGEEDSGVDAKADDFINKFKQQLKLQRVDSIISAAVAVRSELRLPCLIKLLLFAVWRYWWMWICVFLLKESSSG
ncbi:unnamed protein product [Linum trigynum]|uniref:DUF4408 domain-containing protein n=1 Tax=Linum trigynum TaxID=586398 RepID=A0AAV2FKS4_9ROSI